MSEHEFTVEKVLVPESGAVVYRMTGVLGDTHHCYDFLESFLADLAEAPARIVFDFANLESMYSAGIGILANCYTRARDSGKSLVVSGVAPAIQRTLTITGILPMVRSYASEAEALAAAAG